MILMSISLFILISRWWTITKVDKLAEPVQDIFIEGVLNSWNNSQLTVPGVFLEYGWYELRYYLLVNASILFPLQRDDFTYVEIIPVSNWFVVILSWL